MSANVRNKCFDYAAALKFKDIGHTRFFSYFCRKFHSNRYVIQKGR